MSGTGGNADNVIRLDAGLYRVTSTHSDDSGYFATWLEGIASGDRELVANEIGVARAVETVRVGDGLFQNLPGNYLLAVTATESWEVLVELWAAQ